MIKPECILSGDNFDPSDLMEQINDVEIKKISATGDIGKTGRYKGKPIPYGLCIIKTPDSIQPDAKIKWMTTFISRHIKIFRTSGATDIELKIHWKGVQGNMEFSPDELKSIADLRIPMTIDYVFQKDGD